MGGELERPALVVQGDDLVAAERKFGVGLSVFVGELNLKNSVAEKLDNRAYFPGIKFASWLVLKQCNRVQQVYVCVHNLYLDFMTKHVVKRGNSSSRRTIHPLCIQPTPCEVRIANADNPNDG